MIAGARWFAFSDEFEDFVLRGLFQVFVRKEGKQFLDANTPGSVFSPPRYALLTGRYAWRGRLKYGVLSPPESPLLIEPELLTLAEYLKEQGYQTAHVGKWHLGYTTLEVVEDLSAQPLEPGPRSLGFDYHFGVPNNIDWLPKVLDHSVGEISDALAQ